MNQASLTSPKPFTVTAVFDNGSSIKMKLITPFSHIAFENIDVEGDGTLVYTEVRICQQYTKSSSDGGVWQGEICYYTVAH